MPMDFSTYQVGQSINVLGLVMQITQIGTVLVGCSNTDHILVFQRLEQNNA
jgi:hypothetical protein